MAGVGRLTAAMALSMGLASATGTDAWAPYPVATTVLTETKYPTCPPPTTINDTQYLTSTITQTIIYTEMVTVVQPFTEVSIQPVTEIEISPTTEHVTETTPITELVTLTATEKVELETITTRLTKLRICPTRLVNPTYTHPVDVPLPLQWT
jgi:hypothetical protein